MGLAPGTRLGAYEVTAQIGEGGMGQVFRATDTKLKRQVAIKILPAALAADPERLARFQREAEVLASLNHPHIAGIYGLEEAGGLTALVMELVEGEDLSQRIGRGAIPIDEALPIAKQIAEALEAAHEQGIIHRDLKPANIKLRPDGVVKVLDFGLAKALEAEGSAAAMSRSVSMSPTLTSPAVTNVGMILGTAAYMAPEQAKGRPVDKRSDVWAFGCVLYEMLAGVRAFDGDDIAEALASVIKGEPDWARLPLDTPRDVQRLLRQCLRKDPKQRIPDLSLARFELAEIIVAGVNAHDGSRTAAPSAPPASWARTFALAAASAVVAIVATWAWLRPAPSPLTWVRIQRPDGTPIGAPGAGSPDLDISTDGRKVVYVVGSALGGGALQMYVQALDRLEPQSFPNIGNPFGPVFSPNGQWIAFFDNLSLSIKRVPASGGSPVTIAPYTGASRGMSWGGDESIVFATSDTATGLMRVPAQGGTAEVLTTPDFSKGQNDHYFPYQLPNGRGVLFSIVWSGAGRASQIAVFDSRTREYRTILEGASSARYVPTGHIIYSVGGTLRAARFNLDRLEVVGEGVPVLEQASAKPNGAVSAGVSTNGTLAYLHGSEVGIQRSLAWIDRDGREEPIPSAPVRAYVYPRVSPDGAQVALDIRDQENDTWILDLTRGNIRRLTFDPGMNRGVAWSPNGKRVVFSAQRDGRESLYWQSADGTGEPEKLTEGTRPQVPSGFSHDGKFVLFQEPDGPPFDMYMVNVADGKVQPLLTLPKVSESNGQVSPNGRWLAYQSNESGNDDIYVRPFPNVDGAGKWQVSAGGGTRPIWSPTGTELFYLVPPNTIMAASVDIGASSFSWRNPMAVVKANLLSPFSGLTYSVSPDGKRFLVIKDAASSSPPLQLVVGFNWLEELKRLVPTR